MTRLLDPKFKYVPASKTDIRATFRRIQREQQKAQQPAAPTNVQPMPRRKP